MASDLFINSYHQKKRAQNIFNTIKFDHEDYSPEEIFVFEQLKNKYEILIEKMPENQRIVFLMSRIDGFQYKEIAERLGLGVKAVEKRMGIALNYLRQALIDK
jgi:RNA polymerase sigma-70 factor (ECF subfamily)